MDKPIPDWFDQAVHALPENLGARIGDDVVEIGRNGAKQVFVAMPRRVVRPSTLAAVVDQARSLGLDHPPLLVSEHVSTECADLLRARGIQFVDAAGNAYLDMPGYLVVVTGRRPLAPVAAQKDGVGAAALQVAFVLLLDPSAAALSVRAMGDRAGVSHGAAATALNTFERRGWTRNLGTDGHRLVDPEGLLSAWLSGFADRLGPKLVLGRAAAPGAATPEAWGRSVVDRLSPDVGLLGGEVAATIAGLPLHGATGSVYVRAWDAATMKRLRLAPTADGAITIRSAFAAHLEDPSDPRLADPLLVLAEVASIPDERLDYTRAMLRERVSARFQP